MASSDVIELGSSEDEAEPVPKKKKPTPNAMVHFPNEVPGLVIKPVKPAASQLQKILTAGAVTITNVKRVKVPIQVNKAKPNGRSVQLSTPRLPLNIPVVRNRNPYSTNPIAVKNLSVNPLSLIKKTLHTRVQTPKLSLPPEITIKRAANSQNIQLRTGIFAGRRKSNLKRKQPEKIITTVELDDEEVPLTSGISPQWYLRPEEQSTKEEEIKDNDTKDKKLNDDVEKNANMESENNKEPEKKNYIEITIEDSPVKPLQVRRGFEVGTELPITIEDSPIKPIKSVKDQPCASDSDPEKPNETEPQSKKKLDYPKDGDSGGVGEQKIVEIDLEMLPSPQKGKENIAESTGVDGVDETKKDSEIQKVETPRRLPTVLITKEVKDKEKPRKPNTEQKSESSEFHPVYQQFINLCFELENSDDMAKIVEKKIKTYYRQCPKDYVESEEFTDMVSSKIFAMKGAPDKMYLYIKDIVDELNLQRKSAKAAEVSNKENKSTDNNKYTITEDGEYDTKRRRQIRKLDKTIKKLHRAIQKLEEQEVEFEDEEDSVYLLTERYKERLIKVHAKFCQLTNTKMPSEPRIQIEARQGFPAGAAKRLEKWVNKKVPIGKPLPFPDFHDVLRCVREANEEDRLGWNEADIMEEARDLFVRCGKKLQRRRQENEWRIAASRISHDVSTLDPAEESVDLKKKLEDNKTLAAKKEIELLNKYADKQNQLKLVGEEIGDKEAEESPVESEDDDGNDESNSLEDKQKRKERLKRLLHEKTRKISPEKENITSEAEVNKEEKRVVDGEEIMEIDSVSEKSENKQEDNQDVMSKFKVNVNKTITNLLKSGPNNEQNEENTNDSVMYDVDSDIDELHLLQKLYSENEMNSSTQESGSDTPIAISDTLESDSDNENIKIQQIDDIISIENSSYSESEVAKDDGDSTRASAGVKDKQIDGKLLQNTEVLIPSSTSRGEIDIDEENILLASSEEENDVDSNVHANNTENIACGVKSANDGIANDDCEVILDNCVNNSMKNDVEIFEVPLNVDIINKKITLDNSENNISETSKDHFELNEISNIVPENVIKEDSSKYILVSVEEIQDNLAVVRSKSKNVIINNVACIEADCVSSEVVPENDTKFDTCKGDEKHSLKEINTECHKEKIDDELCLESNIIDGNEESASNGIKAAHTEIDFNECGAMDVNVEIATSDSSLTNQQNKCNNVDVVTSVQC